MKLRGFVPGPFKPLQGQSPVSDWPRRRFYAKWVARIDNPAIAEREYRDHIAEGGDPETFQWDDSP